MLLPSPKDRRYLVLAQQLKGTGGRWGLGNLAAQPLSWERAKEMFLAHYVKRNETATARRKLWSIRQAPGGCMVIESLSFCVFWTYQNSQMKCCWRLEKDLTTRWQFPTRLRKWYVSHQP